MHGTLTDYDTYDSSDEEYYDYQVQEDDYEEYADDEYVETPTHGGQRVMRLGLLLLVLLLVAAVIIFGVIPYVDAMTNSAPPLLPAVQA